MTDSVGLASDSPEHIGYLIRRAQQRHLAIWNRIVSPEVSSVQYSILVALDNHGAMSQRELCDAVDLDRSTIADVISRMERRGLVDRQRDTRDARRKVVSMSPLGKTERDRMLPLVEAVQRELVVNLTVPEQNDLRRNLLQVLTESR